MSLKELTAENHKKAEQCAFNQLLMNGKLTNEQYGMYLCSQLAIYSTIENTFGLPYVEMGRQENVLDDLTELGIIDLGPIGRKTKEYCDYIHTLDIAEVLPHIYLNYMAVMMGGQIIKRFVPGSGRMYDFVDQANLEKYVAWIRTLQIGHDDVWAPEVNRAYEYIISIFDELYEYTK